MAEQLRVYLCVLEDDPTWSLPIVQAVKTHLPHVTVKLMKDGKSFLRALSDLPTPDLLILDINTPVMNGLEVLQAVRARRDLDWLPIVMYSTDASDLTKVSALNKGANGFAGKVATNVAMALKSIIEQYSYKGVDKPAIIHPPLLQESAPTSSGWSSIDDMLDAI